jgi:putative salt-induced outer membrane protein YdiY
MKKFGFMALVLALVVMNSHAITAVSNPDAPKPSAADAKAVTTETNQPSLWDSSVAFGLALARGNSDTLLTSAGFKTHRNNLTNEVTFSTDGSYGKSHAIKNNEALHGIGQYNHLFSTRIYGYGRADTFHDDIADLAYRLTLSPGAGYYLLRGRETTLAMEAGPGCVVEKLDGSYEDYAATRVAERFEHKWDGHTRVWENVEFLPQFDQSQNFIVNAEIGAEAALTKRISLRTVLQDNFINVPAPGRKPNDLKLISGLVFKF